eukprot:12235733-Heterocapsa_arctica.AAC.1
MAPAEGCLRHRGRSPATQRVSSSTAASAGVPEEPHRGPAHKVLHQRLHRDQHASGRPPADRQARTLGPCTRDLREGEPGPHGQAEG